MQIPQSLQRVNHTSDLRISKKNYRKDGKQIGDLLNYKDYALD